MNWSFPPPAAPPAASVSAAALPAAVEEARQALQAQQGPSASASDSAPSQGEAAKKKRRKSASAPAPAQKAPRETALLLADAEEEALEGLHAVWARGILTGEWCDAGVLRRYVQVTLLGLPLLEAEACSLWLAVGDARLAPLGVFTLGGTMAPRAWRSFSR